MDLTRWQPRCVGDVPPAQVEFKRRGVASRLDVADVQNVAFETVDRVREPGSWKHKVNYTGFYWAATTGGHVWFESLYEMAALMRLDRDPTVLAISAQPMRIHWAVPRGQGDVQDHTPDFFVRWRDGTAALVDVKPARNIKPKDIVAFDRTLSLCSELGWDYFVVDDISEAEAHNLRFLSGYRYARWHDETCVELLHEQAGRAARLSVWEELLRDACPEPLRTGPIWSARRSGRSASVGCRPGISIGMRDATRCMCVVTTTTGRRTRAGTADTRSSRGLHAGAAHRGRRRPCAAAAGPSATGTAAGASTAPIST
ncbi:TnsA-like heteromeric transposase endonuclease subunit [Microbacterium sp. WHRI 7836]|uniref:TnsA-like heteromeric transposase endonuclease subunit n=1 Tax=Microbacterium sp. WHRI 7836 TaxID=3162563 RepID=UPI0032F0400F